MKNFLKAANIIYFASIFICNFVILLFFGIVTRGETPSVIFKIFSAIADSLLIIFPCLFLRGRWKLLSVLIPFMLSLLLWANLLYYRNFGDLIPASLYLHNQIYDPTVVSAVLYSIKWVDIILLIMPFVPIAVLCLLGANKVINSSLNKKYILLTLSILLVSWGITYAGAYRRIGIYNNTSKYEKIIEQLFPQYTTSWSFYYDEHNFTGYIIKCLKQANLKSHTLTTEELEYIKRNLCRKSSSNINNSKHLMEPDNHVTYNLIMIVVESLPYRVLQIEERNRIIPVLTQIVTDSNTIVSSCYVLTGAGNSSDAQFMYNTGLLPLSEEPLVANYASKPYPSIAKALHYHSMEIIGENKSLWSHSATTQSYGFDSLISGVATQILNQDSVILARATEEIKKLHQPFFLFVSTLSMHQPFGKPLVTHELSTSDLQRFNDSRDREYLQRVKHFDHYLGEFLDNIKQQELYNNSVIVILGDHNIGTNDVSGMLYDDSVPFIILNSPIKAQNQSIRTTQIDVFPTLIDIFQPDYTFFNVAYTGLGKSIFCNDSSLYLPADVDYEISSLIIKSRFNP